MNFLTTYGYWLAFILINNLIWMIWSIYIISKLNKNKKEKEGHIQQPTSNFTIKDIQEDLMNIINYKCYVAYRRVLQPLVDKALKNTPLINDKIVNTITIQITKELLNELSEDYLEKLKTVYNSENIEDILLDLVYNVITDICLSINKKSIKKMNLKNTFNHFSNINQQDFDG